MKSFYNFIWEKSSEWKFEPVILLWSFLTLRPYSSSTISLLIVNFIGVLIYYGFDKKFTFKYSRRYFIVSVFMELGFLALIFVVVLIALLILGFADGVLFSDEAGELVFFLIKLGVVILKIIYGVITSRVYQRQKKLAYAENYQKI